MAICGGVEHFVQRRLLFIRHGFVAGFIKKSQAEGYGVESGLVPSLTMLTYRE